MTGRQTERLFLHSKGKSAVRLLHVSNDQTDRPQAAAGTLFIMCRGPGRGDDNNGRQVVVSSCEWGVKQNYSRHSLILLILPRHGTDDAPAYTLLQPPVSFDSFLLSCPFAYAGRLPSVFCLQILSCTKKDNGQFGPLLCRCRVLV